MISWRFLTRKFPIRNYFFYLPRVCLRIMGVWPGDERTWRNNTLAGVNFVLLSIGVFTELLAGIYYVGRDLELGLDTLCPAATSFVCLLKMLFIALSQKKLQSIFQEMHSMLFERQLNIRNQQILHEHLLLAARLNFLPFIMGFITACTYNLKPFFMACWMWYVGKNIELKMPFNMMLPAILLDLPYLPFTFIYIAYTSYQTIFLFGGADALYFEFCVNSTALLELLQEDMKSLFNQYTERLKLNELENLLISRQLARIVDYHNNIIQLTHKFRDCYAVITLVHFVTAASVIGVSIFDMLTFTGFGFIIYFNYTLAAVMQLFIYCYGGTLLHESSERVANTLFQCNWYSCNPKLRRMILLIMVRAQKGIIMSVPFFSPSLPTLTLILKTSASFMALALSFSKSV